MVREMQSGDAFDGKTWLGKARGVWWKRVWMLEYCISVLKGFSVIICSILSSAVSSGKTGDANLPVSGKSTPLTSIAQPKLPIRANLPGLPGQTGVTGANLPP